MSDRPPDRWLKCPRKALGLIADKFLAFKTPLDSKFDVPLVDKFDPEMLFNNMKSYKAEIGLWIDLTNTSRFYDKKIIKQFNCKYKKIQCRGHGETPSRDQVQNFIEVARKFIEQNPLKLIGVHCTHGFNRTGFMIVSFLVEVYDMEVGAAMKQFASVRPPGIYKKDYIDELFKIHDDVEYAPPAPQLPDWCIEYDDGDKDDYAGNESDNPDDGNNDSGDPSSTSGKKKKRRKEKYNQNATFMEGVPGVYLIRDENEAAVLQQKVQALCNWQNKGFPGSQPVSMDNENIKKLEIKPYRVSWKADGTRYMMLIDKLNEIYFFDRDNSVFKVESMYFPHKMNIHTHLVDTLLDGEMVMDKVEGQNIPRYLVYDIICLNGRDVSQEPFYPNRLKYVEAEIVAPRHRAMKEGKIERIKEPFSIRNKSFWDVTQAENLLGPKFAKSLSHEPDGLIFQPSLDPYVPGACSEVLKWKPLSMNSIDFKLKINTLGGLGILPKKTGFLYVGQCDQPFATMDYTKQLKELDGKIIECKLENNKWVFMRERTDKSFPNSYSTAEAVWHSIKNPVTTEKLLRFIQNHRFRNDHDLMPPPDKKMRRN
ncbi:mRNA-capping enzyme-like [Ctenocephalides felis]|uniref:mRNA-capping enzyme-like n=1 Tax=Ctenocephalides felis TaxID=7515 RepID=UPI000E6E5872|nr:mRNA-capping enzyme-like [Ctenocephalides felis]